MSRTRALDIAYVFTDGSFPAEPLLQVGRC
jgi:hypothetical protein